MKTVKTLINSERNKTLGNHYVQVVVNKDVRYFYYHSTAICKVNDRNKTFKLDNGGWCTVSTTRAINSYRRNFSELGYKEVDEFEF